MPLTAKKRLSVRLDKQALFRRVRYEPHPGQLQVHTSTAQRRVLACGVRWGKSRCAAMEGVAALMAPAEESLGWVVAPTFDLCGRVFNHIQRVVHEHFRHRIVGEDPRDHSLSVRNLGGGVSVVKARSADNPVGLLGEALDYVIVDEAARLKREVWEGYLSQRLIDRAGWALLLSTPVGDDWFFRAYRQGQGRRPDPAYETWNSPSWDNPHLEREVIDEERERLPDEVFKREYGAEFGVDFVVTCETCKGPREGARSVIVVKDDEEPPYCADCGSVVNEQGLSCIPLWNGKPGGVTIIRVHTKKLRDPPPIPGMEEDEE